ncbi:MAG: hypothetical protein LBP56_07680 [Odoribacteraceae bacterium]|jgi:hypothetical protein|nr:hypothetical protein [Odoribacteraceae bacterium]
MTIQEAIRRMATAGAELYCKACTVDAVNEAARTVDCSPLDEGAPLVGVKLQANQGGEEGVVLFPAVGSHVVVSFIAPAVAVVILAERVDAIVLKVGGTTARVTGEGVEWNGGGLGGLVVAGKVAERLNALEQEVNALKAVLAAWAPVAQDGGASLKAAAATWAGSPLAPTTAAGISNDKIKQ